MTEEKLGLDKYPNLKIGFFVLLGLVVVAAGYFMFGPDRVWLGLTAVADLFGVHIQDVPVPKE